MQIKKVSTPLLMGIAIAIGILIGYNLSFFKSKNGLFTTNTKKQKLNKLIDYIDYEYVDTINTDSIVDVTVNEILGNLDPHSTYIPKEDLQRVTESMKGDFVGIGVSIQSVRDTITVIRTIEDGPAVKAGIRAGDRILIANKDTVFGKGLNATDVVKKLKGTKGSKVTLNIFRKASPQQLLTFKVKRGNVALKSVDAAYMITDSLGYIKINRFAESTYNEFKTRLNQLQNQGANKLILDLRDNPGGFLSVTEQILDEFLENKKLLFFTKNNKGYIKKRYATKKGDFEHGGIFVLINENSASASEIIAGALQDNDKGIIVGRRSFGKGLVQREMALGDGSAIRLTVSRYYTPTGRSIQRSYKNGDNKTYYNDYFRRKGSGELSDKNNIEIADSLKFTTPKGKIVYGGGGIIPDVFVPIDKSRDNDVVKRIVASNLMSNFMFKELDQNRVFYANMNQDDFIANFELDNTVVERFQEYLSNNTIGKITFLGYNNQIKRYLKAALAEQLFGLNAYTILVNQDDAMLEKVRTLISEKELHAFKNN